ncbi:hypothetical protein BABINDRAFT_148084 [Babjeviella inositovora NRRL Y-12698]|uniref:Uncharacterized protein n=1 Tax=Babjeviella inositovora NRRL Y-12698 TaxID=984486 RepID=A0A1E3QN92_9ASCO|nr:uncharacterized protein BABINDRAFT_148084 [Babjeviella inositovora NRRL Y-12698]ODQ79108.1 hypothetical protein BABINDRAFT_148084 [Babjeviella inositovora NRRL Y-12698]
MKTKKKLYKATSRFTQPCQVISLISCHLGYVSYTSETTIAISTTLSISIRRTSEASTSFSTLCVSIRYSERNHYNTLEHQTRVATRFVS